jgi:hypothetical protein
MVVADANGLLSTQAIGSGAITGSGTTNYVPKFTSASAIGNSNLINDASGNLGLGVTPSAWSVIQAMQVLNTSWGASPNNLILYQSSNVFYDGAFKYITTGTASQYRMNDSGIFSWLQAPSGTAGNAISFTQAMTLTAGGNLLIGTTSDAGYKLDVNGTGRFSGNLQVTTTGSTRFTMSGSDNGILLNDTTVVSTARNWGVFTSAAAEGDFVIQVGASQGAAPSSNVLYFASTGAATFSSSVTASSYVSNGQVSLYDYINVQNNFPNFTQLSGIRGRAYYQTNYPTSILFGDPTASNNNIITFNVSNTDTTGTEKMRLNGLGNLLIGTTTDSGYKLDVNGTGIFRILLQVNVPGGE